MSPRGDVLLKRATRIGPPAYRHEGVGGSRPCVTSEREGGGGILLEGVQCLKFDVLIHFHSPRKKQVSEKELIRGFIAQNRGSGLASFAEKKKIELAGRRETFFVALNSAVVLHPSR